MKNWLIHKLGWNEGRVMSWTTPEGRVWIGFMCDDCGSIHGCHDATDIVEKMHTRDVFYGRYD